MIQERKDYSLLMIDFECNLIKGEPDANKAATQGTKYVDQKWTSDLNMLIDGANKGSACIQLFLNDKGIFNSKNFKTELI